MKKKKDNNQLINYNVDKLQEDYIREIQTNPKYSLNIDPQNKYKFTQEQVDFIKNYIQFKSIATACELSKIDKDKGKEYFSDYNIQKEIKRIYMALYQRQFANKLLNLDQLGGYLTSLLTDDYIPLADQLSTNDKLKVVDLIIKLNQLKSNGMEKPEIIIEKDINTEIKNLSVEAIKDLLEQKNKKKDKIDLVNEIDKENILSLEEKAYLESLSTTELLKMLNDIKKGEKK